jgi:hypothetical protein
MSEKNAVQLRIPEVKSFESLGIKTQRWEITANGLTNKTIVVLTAEMIATEKGRGYVCNCLIDEKEVKVLLAGAIITEQMDAAKDSLPFATTIIKAGRANMLS